jgi:hypothetical protein
VQRTQTPQNSIVYFGRVIDADLVVVAVGPGPEASEQAGTRLVAATMAGEVFRDIGPTVPAGYLPDSVFFLDRDHGWFTAFAGGGGLSCCSVPATAASPGGPSPRRFTRRTLAAQISSTSSILYPVGSLFPSQPAQAGRCIGPPTAVRRGTSSPQPSPHCRNRASSSSIQPANAAGSER